MLVACGGSLAAPSTALVGGKTERGMELWRFSLSPSPSTESASAALPEVLEDCLAKESKNKQTNKKQTQNSQKAIYSQ